MPDAAAAAVSAPPQEEEYAQLGSSVESTQPAGGMTPKATGILARRRERIKALNNPQSPLAELLDADDALLEEASKECLGISAALADSKAGSINLACAGLSTPVSDTVEPAAAAADVDNIAVPTIAQHAAAQGIVKRSRYSRLSRASVLRLVNVGILLWISAVNGTTQHEV